MCNLLGITLNNHTNKIANKVIKTIGILNKLKLILPEKILSTMYNILILPQINCGILLGGHEDHRVFKLQKCAMKILSLSKYNAHMDPILYTLKI